VRHILCAARWAGNAVRARGARSACANAGKAACYTHARRLVSRLGHTCPVTAGEATPGEELTTSVRSYLLSARSAGDWRGSSGEDSAEKIHAERGDVGVSIFRRIAHYVVGSEARGGMRDRA
jgi:hypothetical protein